MIRPFAVLLSTPLVLLVLALPGCSDDQPGPSGGPGAEASAAHPGQLREGLAGLFAGDHAGDEETRTAECFARELTGLVSPERLREAGVVDSSYDVVADLPALPEDVAAAWTKAQFRCTDFVEESAQAQVAVTRGAIDAGAYRACLRDELSDEDLRAAVEASLRGSLDDDAVSALARAQVRCAESATPPNPAG